MRNIKKMRVWPIVIIVGVLVFGGPFSQITVLGAVYDDPLVIKEAVNNYINLLKTLNLSDRLLYADNLTGRIVWNEQYFMNSLLNMYIATGKSKYLDLFREHARHVMMARDDMRGYRGPYGRSLPGWSAGSYYTLGRPYVIDDVNGSPSLLVQSVHMSGNGNTSIDIIYESADSAKFTVTVTNDFRKSKYKQTYRNLTLNNIEKNIDSNLSPRKFLRVQVLGANPPKAGHYELSATYTRVFMAEHTGLILLPMLRYLYMIEKCGLNDDGLSDWLRPLVLQSLFSVSAQSDDRPAMSYIVYDPSPTYWAAGMPVPYNVLSANGLSMVYAYLVYGIPDFKDKALMLAKKIKDGIRLNEDDTLSMAYWYGMPYEGRRYLLGESPVSYYRRFPAVRGEEDISHFTLTLWFMNEMTNLGLYDFSKALKATAYTFTKKIYKPSRSQESSGFNRRDQNWSSGVFLSHTLSGRAMAYDYAAGLYALVAKYDPTIMKKVHTVYVNRYSVPRTASSHDIDYVSGYVMLGWSLIARNGDMTIKCVEKK